MYRYFLFRYSKSNAQSSSAAKSYSVAIPAWLHNRPRDMIAHCMPRLDDARLVSVSAHGSDLNLYTVKGNSEHQYEVSLSPVNRTCYDSCRSVYPCKHIFAVMYFADVSFDTLEVAYRDNPWFTLDNSAMYSTIFNPKSDPQPTPIEETVQTLNKVHVISTHKNDSTHKKVTTHIWDCNAATY